MRTELNFIIKEDKIYLLRDVPEEPNEKEFSGDQWKEANAYKEYEKAIQKAKDNSALVSDQEKIRKMIGSTCDRIYIVTGYMAKIKKQFTAEGLEDMPNAWKDIPNPKPKNWQLGEAWITRDVAIISPIEPEENKTLKECNCYDKTECLEFGCQKPKNDWTKNLENGLTICGNPIKEIEQEEHKIIKTAYDFLKENGIVCQRETGIEVINHPNYYGLIHAMNAYAVYYAKGVYKTDGTPNSKCTEEQFNEVLEALCGIINIGKRDMSNLKYDSYFNTALEVMKKHNKR